MDKSFYQRQNDSDNFGQNNDDFEDYEMYTLEEGRFTDVPLDPTEQNLQFLPETQHLPNNNNINNININTNYYPNETFSNTAGPQFDTLREPVMFPNLSPPETSPATFTENSLPTYPESEIDYPRHPLSCVFHILFKIIAITMYELTYYFWAQFIIIFVIVVTLLALDFWTVKNVTGRFLVGLRWWNDVHEDGTNNWRFESISREKRRINPREELFFWGVMGISLCCWLAVTVIGILSLKWRWILICLVAIILHAANIAGYLKCSQEARLKVAEFANEMMVKKAADYLINGDSGRMFSNPIQQFSQKN